MQDMLYKRRSIRKYTAAPIEKEKVDQLVQTALLAPTSRNTRAWEFIVVDDRGLLERLSTAKVGAQPLKGAALAIVVLADPLKSDVWVEDTSIATILLQLTAQALGLGSCWIQIRERLYKDGRTAGEYVKEVLQIPDHLQVESIVSLGYSDEQKAPHSQDELKYEKIHYNAYDR